MTRSQVHAVRWRRWGKDRLYVNLTESSDDGDAAVGFVDLLTGYIQVKRKADLVVVEQALATWLSEHPDVSVPRTPARGETDPAPQLPQQSRPAQPVTAATVPTHGPSSPAPSAPDSNQSPKPAPAPSAPPPAVLCPPPPSVPGVDWVDLAANRAGQQTALQASMLAAEAPVRTMVARLLDAKTEERGWRVGAKGERAVGRTLARPPRPWRALHAVPVGTQTADIDHVIIGPAGIFTLNTKHHPGGKVWVGGNTVLVNGARTHYVRNARHEAVRAGKLLSKACGTRVVPTPMVVLVGCDLTAKSQPADVVVVHRDHLVATLSRLPRVYTTEEVEALYAWARRSTTWYRD